jgi:uncharacterized membrane protein
MRLSKLLRGLLAALMVSAGILHFARPGFFVAIVPKVLPAPEVLVAVSGFFEILGGLGILFPPTRKAASLGLIALLICVFPANIDMVVHPSGQFPMWGLIARLPLQAVFLWMAWRAGKPDPR